ncbi:hypothetical protein ASE79_06220 [Sphingomonas sp. Leaf28]|nr:hypothetical protein ASE79_06220 [Sphingomonas sp. Leaf28]
MLQESIDACDRPSIASTKLGLHDKLVAVCRDFRRQAAWLGLNQLRFNILLGGWFELDRLRNLVCQQQI